MLCYLEEDDKYPLGLEGEVATAKMPGSHEGPWQYCASTSFSTQPPCAPSPAQS